MVKWSRTPTIPVGRTSAARRGKCERPVASRVASAFAWSPSTACCRRWFLLKELEMGFIAPLVFFVLIVVLIAYSVNVLREYQRAVVFQLGRFWKVKGPGLFILVPFVQQMVRTDLRTVVLDVPSQDVISRDNVSVKVNAVVYFRFVDPQKAIIEVENFMMATSQLAQTTLRSVLGKHELDEMLSQR